MQVKFNGVPGEDLESISMYGTIFPKGKFVDVADPFASRKLAEHPHFTAKGEEVTDVNPKALAKVEKAVELLEEAAAIEKKNEAKAEAETIAQLTDEDKYGSDAGTAGNADAAQAGRPGGKRGRSAG